MILITGADGFIGRQVCRLLSANGQDILAVDRNFTPPYLIKQSSRARRFLPGVAISTPPAEIASPAKVRQARNDRHSFYFPHTARATFPFRRVQGDLTSDDFLSGLFREHSFEAIIHLAGLLNTASRQQPLEAMRVNIGCSLSLLQLAIRFNVSKFIYGSSISAYGAKPFAEFGEVSEAEPASPNNVYGVSKRFVEIAGENFRKQGAIQFIALRISMVVGTGAASISSPWRSAIFEKLNSPQPITINLPFAPHERLPLVHVAGVAEMIKQLSDAGQTLYPIYNTPSDNLSCGDLADAIQALNRNLELAFGPTGVRGDPEAINGSRFVEEFGFRPIPLKEQLIQAIENRQQGL